VIEGPRTLDLQSHNLALFQLSYDHRARTSLARDEVLAAYRKAVATWRRQSSSVPVTPPPAVGW
jgi:hypothetical protein